MERDIVVGSIGMALGALIMTIWLNLDAQENYIENPNLTLQEYWKGK